MTVGSLPIFVRERVQCTKKNMTIGYRRDIDGLRAIAVLAVILFHFGLLPNGYLGVDVFFVISGYLITRIVFREVAENRFSITQFYLRRIRRILPLALFTTSVALFIGAGVMLPDDFENLCESVVATNGFANNILLLITTGDYWNVVNEYKPLMHTWSLGVEEQFYLCYPLLFMLLSGGRIRWIVPVLSLLSATSLGLYLFGSNEAATFYSIQYRFFELSLGGLAAITIRDKTVNDTFKAVSLMVVVVILAVTIDLPGRVKLLSIVLATLGVLLPGKGHQRVSSFILENKVMVGIGVISYSLYMWHQIVLAFTRYCVMEPDRAPQIAAILCVMFLVSVLSYVLVEQPFRDKTKAPTRVLLWTTGTVFALSTGLAFFGYLRSGVIRDVPELELFTSSVQRNLHARYNARIYDFDRNFGDNDRTKVLVIGNSFARDWANILLESAYAEQIDISYVGDLRACKTARERLSQAQFVFFAAAEKARADSLVQEYGIDPEKVWNVGAKNFGKSNGIFYNRKGADNYCVQRTEVVAQVSEVNRCLKEEWGNKYVDLLGMVIDDDGTVPVFTPECRFISQDCGHLTHAGAMYFAELLERDGRFHFE